MINDILLSHYTPKSELRVTAHKLTLPRFDVVDVHMHWGGWPPNQEFAADAQAAVERLKALGVRKVVNLDGWWGGLLERTMELSAPYTDFIATYGSVDVTKLNEPDFEQYVRRTITRGVSLGIKGLKFLKDVSLVLKDETGSFIAADNPRLQAIWQTAAEYRLPVLIHIADPVAFFKPIDRFNERLEELNAHPEWSFHGGGRFQFEELMQMQDNLLSQNPATTFVIAHCGSCAEDLSNVSAMLEAHPNMYVDIAERIAELGRQPRAAKAFLNRWQDRVLFGTDGSPTRHQHSTYYRFLETGDEYFDYSIDELPPQGRWKIYGVELDDMVLRKLYSGNARQALGL